MRTCPNCGKDTGAGMTEPCTNCGFSPGAAPDEATVGQILKPTGDDGPPAPGTSPPSRPRRVVKSLSVGAWVRIAAVVGFFGFSIASNSLFEDTPSTSLNRLNLELSIRGDADRIGLSAFVDCPESVGDSESGDRFACRVENLNGDVRRIQVEDSGSGFTYSTQPLVELKRLDRGSFDPFRD